MSRERAVSLLSAATGAIAAAWVGLPGTVQLLITMQVFDILSGVLAAAQHGRLSSKISLIGLSRKMLMLVAVGFGAVLDHYLALLYPGFSAPAIAAAIAGYYSIYEAISILENFRLGGVPLPASQAALIQELLERVLMPVEPAPVPVEDRPEVE